MRKKQLWLFLAKLIPLTVLFGYLWLTGLQTRYPFLLDPIATPFFQLVGVKRWYLALVLEHFTNIVPYVALVLASPRLIRNWKRSLAALLGGVAVIVTGHLLMSWAVYHFHGLYGLSKAFYRIIVPIYLVNDALPLILWVLFYPKLPGELFGLRIFDRNAAKDKATARA